MAGSELHVRVDGATRIEVTRFAADSGMSLSQAVRVLLQIALQKTSGVRDVVVRQAFTEGVISGEGKFIEAIRTAAKQILNGAGGEA